MTTLAMLGPKGRTPAWAWVGIAMCLASFLVMGVFAVEAMHRMERCVTAVKLAQGVGASTWEAVEKCQNRRTP